MTERTTQSEIKNEERKVSKTWEAAMRLKGSVIVNDKTLFMR